MGRRARPIEMLLLHGRKHLTKKEIRDRRETESRLRPPDDAVKCPSWLDKEGKREWRRITGALKGLGLLTNVDVAALAVYCDQVSTYIELTRRMRTEATVSDVDPEGNPVQIPNPQMEVWRTEKRQLARVIARYLSEFGLSPATRAKLAMPRANSERPKDRYEERFGS